MKTGFQTGVAMLALGLSVIGGINAPTIARADTKMASSAMASDKMHSSKMADGKMAKTLSGSFKQVTHATKGKATVNGRTLTLSGFETGEGPQLHVYLVRGAANSNGEVKAAVSAKKFVDLGKLKSIKGTQTYAIPTSAKIAGSSVVVWCDKFDVAFGSAKLS